MNITKARLVTSTNIPAALVAAVVRQSGGWEQFTERAADVAACGASGGFGGWIYYTETVPFAEKNRREILEYARSMADDLGEPGAYSLIAGFNCFRDDKDTNTDVVADAVNDKDHAEHTNVMNALAWFALEEVSRAYVDATEREG